MPPFQFRELPHYFAVLRATSGGGPSYQLCEAVLQHPQDEAHEEEFAIVKNWGLDTTLQDQFIRLDARPETTVFVARARNEDHRNEDIRQIRWWFLPHVLELEQGATMTSVPVIDSNKRFYLTRTFHRVLPVNVSVGEFQQTVIQYATQNQMVTVPLRPGMDIQEFFGRRVPHRSRSPLWGASRAPPRVQNETPLPSFVMDLLVKDATETNKTCPITMISFAELESIGITSCFHLFELDSLERWKQEHGDCPLCRSVLSTIHVWKKPSSDT